MSRPIAKQYSWVEPGREGVKRHVEVSHLALVFLALFLLSVMNTMMFNDPSHFFQKRKLLLCKFNDRRAIFFIGECVHLWTEWSGGGWSSAELGERSDKLQHGARMPGQRPGWPASKYIKKDESICWKNASIGLQHDQWESSNKNGVFLTHPRRMVRVRT